MLGFNDLSTLEVGRKAKKIRIVELTRAQFKGNSEILNKYFRHNARELDRFHIPSLTDDQYVEEIKDYITNAKSLDKFNKKNIKQATASDYFIRKMRIQRVAKDLGVAPSQIDTTDYYWDDRYYHRYNFLEAVEYAENMYREQEDPKYTRTATDCYIKDDPRTATVDIALFNELYSFCIKAIQNRQAMLLSKVENCLGCLNNIMEYTYGFTQNATATQVATIRKYKEYFESCMRNTEVFDFLKANNDISVFATDELTRNDYVLTYSRLVRMLVSMSDGRSFEDVKDLIDNKSDSLQDEILSGVQLFIDDDSTVKYKF